MDKISKFLVVLMMGVIVFNCQTVLGEDEINPRYQITCPSGSKHVMDAVGPGFFHAGDLSNPGPYILEGQASQCRNCYLVLVSQYNPYSFYFSYVGKFSFWNANYNISNIVEIFNGKVNNFTGNMQADPFWAGFTFVKPY